MAVSTRLARVTPSTFAPCGAARRSCQRHGERERGCRIPRVSTTDPLTIALVAAGSSLLAIFLTPRLQHRLWRRQKRDEIRLATIGKRGEAEKRRSPSFSALARGVCSVGTGTPLSLVPVWLAAAL